MTREPNNLNKDSLHNAVQKIFHFIVITGLPVSIFLMLISVIYKSFNGGFNTGIRNLLVSAIPFVITTLISRHQKNSVLSLVTNNSSLALLISMCFGFLLLTLIDIMANLKLEFPILSLLLSSTLSLLIFERLNSRNETFYYGAILGFLIYIFFIGIPSFSSISNNQINVLNRVTSKEISQNLKVESNFGINYNSLSRFLKSGDFKRANEETSSIIMKILDVSRIGEISRSLIRTNQGIFCKDILTIDRLWTVYSKDHFGFQTQLKLFNESEKREEVFAIKVGWRKFGDPIRRQDLNFTKNAYQGHLPVLFDDTSVLGGLMNMSPHVEILEYYSGCKTKNESNL